MIRQFTAMLTAIAALTSYARPKPEKFPVDRHPIPERVEHFTSGITRRSYRRSGRRSWRMIRKIKNRIARLSRRKNRQRAA